MSATLLLQIVERAHRYMDAHGYPERACPPSFATAELMKEPTVSVVTDLFDKPDRLTADGEPYGITHGSLGGVTRHTRAKESLCAECAAFNRKDWHQRRAEAEADPTPRRAPIGAALGLSTQDAAKALDAHRMERARLRATLTPEERARLAAS